MYRRRKRFNRRGIKKVSFEYQNLKRIIKMSEQNNNMGENRRGVYR